MSLVAVNVTSYLPVRVGGMQRLFGMSRSNHRPFQTKDLDGTLVIVHPRNHWSEYGTLVTLGPPFSDADLLLVHANGPGVDARLQETFPDRRILHYYPAEGGSFYRQRQWDRGRGYPDSQIPGIA